MKKKSPPYPIIIAAVLGLVAIFAAFKWKQNQDATVAAQLAAQKAENDKALADALSKQQAPPPPTPTNMRMVYYATQPVAAGAKISEAFYEKKATPVDILPDAFSDQSDIVGFYAIRNIEKGDPLTPRNIGKTLPFMSQRISAGMRAVSLPIFNADANQTGGFAIDGDKVDLLYTSFNVDGSLLLKTEVVMQNVEILYVPGPKIESEQVNGVTPAPPPGDPLSITFQVTPEQAQSLIFMTHIKNGQFSMILRARSDKTQLKFKPTLAEDYAGNLQKFQKTTDKSVLRVQALAAQIAEQEKNQGSQGKTNETPNPTPPTP